ncbi:MAG: flagellar biosynthetic protein FliR [Gluconacetobacter diazotrophicus]|nr:flagellar biosynthetic protein FliR [Gluconacetobacter diazotrophicus]
MTVLPAFGEASLPTVVKAGLAMGLSLLLLPVVQPLLPHAGLPPLAVSGCVLHEAAVGLLLGWLARLAANALPVSGQVAALQIGLSSVLQTDPDLGAQTSALARLLSLAAPVLILATGLYALPLRALAGSYAVFPPGTAALPAGDVADAVARATEASFVLAIELAAPLIVAGLVWQCLLGLLARLVPSLQVYNLSLPGQVLGGLLVFGLVLQQVLGAWLGGLTDAFAVLPGAGAR